MEDQDGAACEGPGVLDARLSGIRGRSVEQDKGALVNAGDGQVSVELRQAPLGGPR